MLQKCVCSVNGRNVVFYCDVGIQPLGQANSLGPNLLWALVIP